MGPKGLLTDGTEWLLIFALVGFFLSFVLTKIEILNDKNLSKFTSWASGVVATMFAIAANTSASGITDLFGRLAIFVLVWVGAGLLFTFGAAMGMEKANKSKVNKKDADKP